MNTNTHTDSNLGLRADLWQTLDHSQMLHQRDILMDRITLLRSMSDGMTPTAQGLLLVMEGAIEDLDRVIAARFK